MEAPELVQSYEAQLRALGDRIPENPSVFNWQMLAERGGQLRLYEWHRMLSATSAHVTAISLLRGVVPVDGDDDSLRDQLLSIEIYPFINHSTWKTLYGEGCRA